MKKWFLSSTGSGDLSLTIKSLLLGIVPVAVTIAKLHGFEIAESDLVQLVDNSFAALALLGVVIGLARKIWFKLGL